MSINPSASKSLATEVTKYRQSMAGFLQVSLVAMNNTVSSAVLEEIFRPIDPEEFDKDPLIAFRKMSHLLIAKARLHVIAALCANKSNNIHSLAVQTRPALECAGQIVSIFKDLYEKTPRAEKKIGQYLDADYYQTIRRLTKGQVDQDRLLGEISAANPMRKERLRKPRKFTESEKVRDLEFGGNWYCHLSNCFYGSDLPSLKDLSYYGGVSSCDTADDEYAFAALLDYLAHQVMAMLMYAALCAAVRLDGAIQRDERLDKAAELLQKKKAAADHFKVTLMSMAGKRDQ